MIRAALLLGLLAGGCQKPTPNQCPGVIPEACVEGERCTFDEARGCHVCQCDPLGNDNTPDPDDRSRPPDAEPRGGDGFD